MKSVVLLIVSIISLAFVADGETTPRFLKVTYNNKLVNVYGYLNDDIICVESGEREPGIIKISELDDEDAFKVAKKARSDEFKYSNPKLNEITRMFVMSNSVKVKVDLIVAQRHQNYLITDQFVSKEFNIKFAHVQYIKVMPGVDLKRGDQLPPMHRWSAGKVLNPSAYYICPPIDYDRGQDLALNVENLDDAVQLLAGWMLAHKDDYYVQNTLMGVRAKLPSKRNSSPASTEAAIQGGGDFPKQQYGVCVESKSGKRLEEELITHPLTDKEVKAKTSEWLRKNIRSRLAGSYNDEVQTEYRMKLKNVQELVAEMAVVYSDCVGKTYFKECITELNQFYDTDKCREWSRLRENEFYRHCFDWSFDRILSALDAVISQNGDKGHYKNKRDLLWLNYVEHVRSWEELNAKIAAEKERERKEKEAREEWLEDRRVRAEEDRARAIEDQNAILNDIRWSIDNQPAPVNNTYIVTPPPRRRWR